jgi:hypothetical protein
MREHIQDASTERNRPLSPRVLGMTRRASTLLKAEDARLHLSLAGAWAAATRAGLDAAEAATSTLEPATFEAFGVAMSTVLTFHLLSPTFWK